MKKTYDKIANFKELQCSRAELLVLISDKELSLHRRVHNLKEECAPNKIALRLVSRIDNFLSHIRLFREITEKFKEAFKGSVAK